ncbi:hypothetical protein BDR05DRAFT_124112 [Suillus weaverae]|nr:hypothetical protein BDR05DRAFT_124112 [Suillus weaverae]
MEGFIVAANPHARAAELYSGVAGLTGPQPSVAKISSVLYNVDHIKAELRHMKENSAGEFADDFFKFQNEHPGFVLRIAMKEILIMMKTSLRYYAIRFSKPS